MKEKQIEDMAKVVGYTFTVAKGVGAVCPSPKMIAMDLHDAGYRKQSEGEWGYHECVSSYDGAISGYSCSCCCAFIHEEVYEDTSFPNNFCPNCGAKMKGE